MHAVKFQREPGEEITDQEFLEMEKLKKLGPNYAEILSDRIDQEIEKLTV